jgi:2-polyprenyl-6-methoxyphenol hydroxylase-like FAD-dependent oxidoreductase
VSPSSPVIVGGGPVGLFLALALLRRGVVPHVLEPRAAARPGSRSIGIHPPSLELLDELGIIDAFLERGIQVRSGVAMTPNGELGRISFDECPGPYRFVLTLPQEETEGILREELERRAPGALIRAELACIRQNHDHVVIRAKTTDGGVVLIPAPVVVGCDGKHSATRRSAGIGFSGAPYAGRYMMADFPDDTSFGTTAAITLAKDGLLESFPLPGGSRRWVARVDGEGTVAELVSAVWARTGVRLDPRKASFASSFVAERYLAEELTKDRIVLAGDAAHVISPIGGQGMNLGWLGARSIATVIADSPPERLVEALAADGERRKREARAAARRAEVNMWLGKPRLSTRVRDGLVKVMLKAPYSAVFARAFTMRHLSFGV